MSGFADPFLGFGPNVGRATLQSKPLFSPSVVEQKVVGSTPVGINDMEEGEETVDLKYIITEKPKTKIVREYMRYNLSLIKSEEDEMFGVYN